MDDVWNLSTRALSAPLGLVVWDSLVLLVIASCTIHILVQTHKIWPEYNQLQAGLVFLSIWQVLHLIDLIVHLRELVVPYGYIFVQAVFVVPRTVSDVLCLIGCLRVALRYHQMGAVPQMEFVPLAAVCWLLALAHTCMHFGLVFCWLGLVSPTVVDQVARGRSGLEVGSAALQFVIAGYTLLCSDESSNLYGKRPTKEGLGAAVFMLFIRAFCEIVIVGQYDRTVVDLATARTARDVCHGLFSAAFVIFASFFLEPRGGDPLEQVRLEVETSLPGDVVTRLNTGTNGGSQTAPALADLFQEMKREIGAARTRGETDWHANNLRRNISIDYLDRLSARYAGWEPISRWAGATPHTS